MAIVLLFFCFGSKAMAADEQDVVVALGADLSEQQRAAVLELMGLTEADLAKCTVISISNAMEHEYLDAYLDASVIGSKSLSSVKITKAASSPSSASQRIPPREPLPYPRDATS